MPDLNFFPPFCYAVKHLKKKKSLASSFVWQVLLPAESSWQSESLFACSFDTAPHVAHPGFERIM